MKGLEIKQHNENLVSIKDWDGEVDIANRKWNALFSSFINLSIQIYFKGSRPTFFSKEIDSLLANYAEELYNPSFAKISTSSLFIARQGFSQIWGHYEYSSIFFNSMLPNIEGTKKYFQDNNWVLKDIMQSINCDFSAYKSSELDVLWIAKKASVSFPHPLF